ncbi:hypothetical protein ACFQLX_06380 [Streptomyces polyrhachis]|uniref:Uncharacterized protein n=1 Tax=Streptomyces polyrhachis TaxID=1282885 RepID=A0ABW2GDM5_9ACTN
MDLRPGAEVPLTGGAGQTVASNALASAAYRDGSPGKLLEANSELSKTEFKEGRLRKLFEPNFGEAFSRAVQTRLLGGGRKQVIQSFGTDPQAVVEHCLSASRLRRERDDKLTVAMLVFGVAFLPGLLLWLGAFWLRRTFAGSQDKKVNAYGIAALAALAVMALLLFVRLPLDGAAALYVRAMVIAPAVGWLWARQICERTARDLRARWLGLLSGGGVAAKIPEAVPRAPGETAAETLRQQLARLSAEQQSNVVFYAGPKGILGMGTRWGSWQLAEDLVARTGSDIHPFRSWDVAKAIHAQLKLLERKPIHTGGFPTPATRDWIVSPIGENATEVARPEGLETDGFRVKDFEVQRICNEQQFGSGNRHYLGVQFVLWEGQLVITMLVTVTVLHQTLRVEVTGYALGPVHPLFTTKPKAETKDVAKSLKFWETKKVELPVVPAREVVRLAVRAPFSRVPGFLDWIGGRYALPEPFGMRHVWAGPPWRHRFMADDALRAATPVLRVVHAAALKVLAENGVDTTRFGERSRLLSGFIQGVEPAKADVYDA